MCLYPALIASLTKAPTVPLSPSSADQVLFYVINTPHVKEIF